MTELADLRLVSYESADGSRGGVVADGHVHDLETVLARSGLRAASVLDALAQWDVVKPALSGVRLSEDAGQPLAATRLLAPILYPPSMFCAGANYTDHIEEMSRVLGYSAEGMRREGDLPWFFVTTPIHSVVGPDAPVALPAYAQKVDWEAEIALVIGRAARNVPPERAMDHVAGLTIVNDLSARDHVKRAGMPAGSPFEWDWLSQKCFEGSKPMGPWIVPLEGIPDLGDLSVRLLVNGETMQDSNSRNLIFGMDEQIAFLSTRVTLRPGDVIATGTPAGVGLARGRWLKPGDEVRVEIGGVGTLRNPIVAAHS